MKCDEQQPVCRRCVRQQKACIYTSKKWKRLLSTTSPISLGGVDAASLTPRYDNDRATLDRNESAPSHQWYDTQSPPACSPAPTGTPSPSLLSTLISRDIYLCTTIDLLAAKERRSSFNYFMVECDLPFIAPFDPVNWTAFKTHVLESAQHNSAVCAAAEAVQCTWKARVNALPHSQVLKLCEAATVELGSELKGLNTGLSDAAFVSAFLLSTVEMVLPGEMKPHLLNDSQSALDRSLSSWASSASGHSAMSLRITSWWLICHAAARRGGNIGLLSTTLQSVLQEVCSHDIAIPAIDLGSGADTDRSLLATLTEPLFTFYYRLQILSARVADLSHYHRSRTTGADQEEVATLMEALKIQVQALWAGRPSLLYHSPYDIRTQFTSPSIAAPLALLITLCQLIYHTELVEIGRNLSAEQTPSAEARAHLAHMRDIMSDWLDHQISTGKSSKCQAAAFIRPLFLYAIETADKVDADWAFGQMRKVRDPICYSEFFANFAEGLADMQRRKQRRVTTRWWCLQEFGIPPPYL